MKKLNVFLCIFLPSLSILLSFLLASVFLSRVFLFTGILSAFVYLRDKGNTSVLHIVRNYIIVLLVFLCGFYLISIVKTRTNSAKLESVGLIAFFLLAIVYAVYRIVSKNKK